VIEALDLLNRDIQQTDRGAFETEQGTRQCGAHQCEFHVLARARAQISATSWRESPPALAPTSSSMHSLSTVGQMAAMAGRSTPAMVFRQNFAMTISAPVLPAETAAPAWPSRTASRLSHMLEW